MSYISAVNTVQNCNDSMLQSRPSFLIASRSSTEPSTQSPHGRRCRALSQCRRWTCVVLSALSWGIPFAVGWPASFRGLQTPAVVGMVLGVPIRIVVAVVVMRSRNANVGPSSFSLHRLVGPRSWWSPNASIGLVGWS